MNMTSLKSRFNYKNILYTTGSILAGMVIKELITKGWEVTNGSKPPKHMDDENASAREVLMWTVGLSVISGLGKLAYESIVSNPQQNRS